MQCLLQRCHIVGRNGASNSWPSSRWAFYLSQTTRWVYRLSDFLSARRRIVDTISGETLTAPVYQRRDLAPGTRIPGPSVIVEQDTATVVSSRFRAAVHPLNYLVLERLSPEEAGD